MAVWTLKVEGMKCGGCEGSVRTLLESQPGVSDVVPSFREKQVRLTVDESVHQDPAALCELLKSKGYSASV
ncbi:MAG: Heavy-metal-associated domain [Pseudomonadota bacterium]|jgi:copper chaperone CopZ